MAKKILIISSVVFVIAVSALIISKVFLSEGETGNLSVSNDPADDSGAGGEGSGLFDSDNSDEGEFSRVLERRLSGATTEKNRILFYDDQRFLSADYKGDIRDSLGAWPFVMALEIKWHPEKEKALVNDNGKYYVYSLEENDAQEFSVGADVAVWDVFGDQIIFKKYDPDASKRILAIANPSGENQETLIEDLPFKMVDFTVPAKGSTFCYFPSPNSLIEGELNCMDLRTKEREKIHSGYFGADYLISPNGKKVLVSYAKEKGGDRMVLGVMDIKGREFQGLNFSTTVKKCVWAKDSKHVYCGTINNIPSKAVLPNDWESEKYHSSDTFWKINTSDGKQERLIDLEQTPGHLDGAEYFLDEEEKNLFFVERESGNLYRIEL